MTTLATINQQGINTMVVDNQTATRIATIMSRSNDVITSVGKAMMISLWKEKAKNGEVLFSFVKRDGSVRIARGTIKFAGAMVNGRGVSRENYATCAFMDLEDSMKWKSFRWDSLLWVAKQPRLERERALSVFKN
jgi:hypothetical protein